MKSKPLVSAIVTRRGDASVPIPAPPGRDTAPPKATEKLADGLFVVFGARNAAVYDLEHGSVDWLEVTASEASERGDPVVTHFLARGQVGGARLPPSTRAALIGQHAMRVEALPVARNESLRFLWLELSDGCNLACTHCYASSGGEHRTALSTQGYGKLIDDAAALGCEVVQLTGGEPLIHPDLLALVDRARAHRLNVEVYSNLALLSDELADGLAARGVQLATSFYSDRASDHEAVTRVPGSFQKTVDGMRRALARRIPLRVGIILQGSGYERRETTFSFLVDLGVAPDGIRYDEVRPEGRGIKDAVRPGAPTGGQDSCSQAPQRAYRRPLDVRGGRVRGNNCWGGELNVTAKGDVVPCIFERKLGIGQVTVDGAGLTELATSGRAKSIWSITLEDCRVCRDCEFRYSCFDCRFSTFRATGDLYAKPPGCAYDPYTGRYEDSPMPAGPARRRHDLIVEEVEGGLVALDEKRGEAHALNATAAAVFELLDGARDPETIATVIADATGAPRARVLEDVRAAITDFAAKGLLEA